MLYYASSWCFKARRKYDQRSVSGMLVRDGVGGLDDGNGVNVEQLFEEIFFNLLASVVEVLLSTLPHFLFKMALSEKWLA